MPLQTICMLCVLKMHSVKLQPHTSRTCDAPYMPVLSQKISRPSCLSNCSPCVNALGSCGSSRTISYVKIFGTCFGVLSGGGAAPRCLDVAVLGHLGDAKVFAVVVLEVDSTGMSTAHKTAASSMAAAAAAMRMRVRLVARVLRRRCTLHTNETGCLEV